MSKKNGRGKGKGGKVLVAPMQQAPQTVPLPAARTALAWDCFSGIAGDMALAALLDAGASLDRVRDGLGRLGLPPFELATEAVQRAGIRATLLHVTVPEERRYQPAEMRRMVEAAEFPARVSRRSLEAIAWLERGESTAHDTHEPHFHEVGGVDALIDICGTMLALEDLGVDEIWCAVIAVGSGTITRSEHGAIPAAPGPAAAAILQEAGFALRFVEAAHELVTPTGAAILAAVAKPGAVTIVPRAHGYGAGTFDSPSRPNAVRAWAGTLQADEPAPADRTAAQPGGSFLHVREVALLEANIDDMTPELLSLARDRMLEEGAFDAWIEAIGMKKGRSAAKLCALVHIDEEGPFVALFLSETSTLGVRTQRYRRYEAARHVETRETPFGPVRYKVREWRGERRATPEFDDIRDLARRTGRPALELMRALEGDGA